MYSQKKKFCRSIKLECTFQQNEGQFINPSFPLEKKTQIHFLMMKNTRTTFGDTEKDVWEVPLLKQYQNEF